MYFHFYQPLFREVLPPAMGLLLSDPLMVGVSSSALHMCGEG